MPRIGNNSIFELFSKIAEGMLNFLDVYREHVLQGFLTKIFLFFLTDAIAIVYCCDACLQNKEADWRYCVLGLSNLLGGRLNEKVGGWLRYLLADS